jgi:metallo-beta-lactamase class B
MCQTLFLNIIFIAILAIVCFSSEAQKVNEPKATDPAWSKPYAPFRIAGNLYYVGTYDLACYLIATTQGNILINTGLAASAVQIKDNIEMLAFKFSDTKIL